MEVLLLQHDSEKYACRGSVFRQTTAGRLAHIAAKRTLTA